MSLLKLILPPAAIRLTGGTKPTQGRLEVFQGTTWGIFCGSTWTHENTQVVCRQLEFPGSVTFSFSSTAVSGANDGGVHLVGDISCNGCRFSCALTNFLTLTMLNSTRHLPPTLTLNLTLTSTVITTLKLAQTRLQLG